MIALDTHALIWWVSGGRQLGRRARKALEAEGEDGRIIVSAISAWEIAMLVRTGRLALTMDVTTWLDITAQLPAVSIVPIDAPIAVQSVELPGDFHKDPADRLIVATARHYGAPLATADAKIQAYPHVQTIW